MRHVLGLIPGRQRYIGLRALPGRAKDAPEVLRRIMSDGSRPESRMDVHTQCSGPISAYVPESAEACVIVIESDEEPATTEPASKKAKTAQRKAELEEELAKKQACARAGEDDGGGRQGGVGSVEEGGRGGGEEEVPVVLQVVTKSGARAVDC